MSHTIKREGFLRNEQIFANIKLSQAHLNANERMIFNSRLRRGIIMPRCRNMQFSTTSRKRRLWRPFRSNSREFYVTCFGSPLLSARNSLFLERKERQQCLSCFKRNIIKIHIDNFESSFVEPRTMGCQTRRNSCSISTRSWLSRSTEAKIEPNVASSSIGYMSMG